MAKIMFPSNNTTRSLMKMFIRCVLVECKHDLLSNRIRIRFVKIDNFDIPEDNTDWMVFYPLKIMMFLIDVEDYRKLIYECILCGLYVCQKILI